MNDACRPLLKDLRVPCPQSTEFWAHNYIPQRNTIHFVGDFPLHLITQVYSLKPHKEKMGQFALEIAAYSLDFFEKFFDQKFPLPIPVLSWPVGFDIFNLVHYTCKYLDFVPVKWALQLT